MTGRSKTYLSRFVIGFGFLSGIWTAIGLDPEEVLLNLLGSTVTAVYPDPNIRTLFLILPTALLLFSIYGAYRKGRALGIIAVIVAYAAGLSILVSLTTTVILLLAALVLGYLATSRRLARNLVGR